MFHHEGGVEIGDVDSKVCNAKLLMTRQISGLVFALVHPSVAIYS